MKMWREKLVPAKNVSKPRAALKKETAGRSATKSYRELGRKIQVHHNNIKK
jgi:hypothetical protein